MPTPEERQAALEILGLENNANDDAIRKAYRILALANHPDKNLNDPLAAKKFNAVKAAYDTAMDPAVSAPAAQPTPKPESNSSDQQKQFNQKQSDELAAFENKLFANIQAQNAAFIAAGSQERISIKRLGAENQPDANQPQQPQLLAIEDGETPQPKPLAIQDQQTSKMYGVLIPFNEGQIAQSHGKFENGGQYQVDYTDKNGNNGSAVYDNRPSPPEIYVDWNNHASIEAGVKAGKAAGSTGIWVYDDLPKEKQEEVKARCTENGMTFSTNPRPTPKPNYDPETHKKNFNYDSETGKKLEDRDPQFKIGTSDGAAKDAAADPVKQIEGRKTTPDPFSIDPTPRIPGSNG